MSTCAACSALNDDAARFCSNCGAQLLRSCPACGALAPLGARFCPECGTALNAPATSEPLEERRLVSIVFADLAGFTERSDRADPEDVRGILLPFHALAKEEIERFGGTLDKFIGDAAMGVFGAPVAHEDDAERAVRAALAIRDLVKARGMPVRIAVNTGEALVTFGEGPQVGEHVAGDVVNTASRLQGLAPEGEAVVGEATARSTRTIIDYEQLPPATVKGKTEPLVLWLARSVRATVPEREEDDPPPFVGRERERATLRALADRAIRDRTPHLVTVVGEPGLGKSRLLADLAEHARVDHPSVRFHRGRCLPYGESITFAALEDIVRALLGVAPVEGRDRAVEALDEHLPDLEPDVDERGWLRDRIAALVGPASGAGSSPDRTESFAAWTRFLELESARGPLAIVVEDLHWAEGAMLEFLDHLLERASDVPLLIVSAARPELFATNPSWGSGIARATIVTLSPLSDPEMQLLLGGLLVRSIVGAEAGDELMRRAGGNPLYAREFVHMLEDRGSEDLGARADAAGVNVPDTVQALIAARLDALTKGDRDLLQAAAVIGDRFWPGAVSALSEVADPEEPLLELQRRGLVRRSPLSTIGGETEFAFTHALIRDVAYGRLPRASRARMHLAVTRWLESTAGGASSDRADLLAFHASRALELTRAAGLPDDLPELEATAFRFLVMAGERQSGIDARRAADYYAEAIPLGPSSGVERAELLRVATGLGWRSGAMTSDQAVAAYRTAIELARDAGDTVVAGKAMRRLYFQLGLQGETVAARAVVDEAIEMLERTGGADETLAELYACRSEAEMFAGRSEGSLQWAGRALELPRSDDVTLMALHLRGNARCELGDLDGLTDLREALALAESSGRALDLITSYSYLAEWVGLLEGLEPALDLNRGAIDLSERRGLLGQAMWARAESMWLLFDTGDWDEIMRSAEPLTAWAQEQGDVQVSTVAATFSARVLAHRGDAERADRLVGSALPVARQIEDLQVLGPTLLVAAVVASRAARTREALELLREFDEVTTDAPSEYRELQLPEVVRVALACDDLVLAERLIGDRPVHAPRTALSADASRAAVLEASDDLEGAAAAYQDVATRWEAWDVPFERAQALIGFARCAQAMGTPDDARAAALRARGLLETLGVLDLDA